MCAFVSSVISLHLDGWDRTKDGCGLRFKVPSQCSQGKEREVDGSNKAGQVAAGQMQETCQGYSFLLTPDGVWGSKLKSWQHFPPTDTDLEAEKDGFFPRYTSNKSPPSSSHL